MRSPGFSNAPHSCRILLVDDNSDGVMARRSVLEEHGYKVVPTGCGLDALRAVEKENFDLIITVYEMSPINGVELIAKLRETQFRKPIILLAGFADSFRFRAQDTGADVVIQKSANEVTSLLRHAQRLLHSPAKKPPRSVPSGPKNTRSHSAGS